MNRKQRRAGETGTADPAIDQLIQQAMHLQQAGRAGEADQCYAHILEKHPKHGDALHLRGILHFQAGRLESAEKLIRKAARHHPKQGIFLASLALLQEQMGKLPDAEKSYAKAVKLSPDHAEAWNNYAGLLASKGEVAQAVQAYEKAISLQPGYLQAIYNLAVMLLNHGRLEQSLPVFEQGLALEPGHPEFLINYGVALQRLKRYDAAEQAQLGILEHSPGNPGALTNLASLYFEIDRLKEAEKAAREALDKMPDLAPAWNNLGNVLGAYEDFEEGEAAFKKALELAPNYADAHGNLANLLEELNCQEEADHHYSEACRLEPGNPRHRFQHAIHHMTHGNLAAAWPLYESGFPCGERKPNRTGSHPAPRWAGEPLDGKCLHIWPEQGIGDELHMASIFAEAAELAQPDRLTIECDPRLVACFQRSFPNADIFADGTFKESEADAQIPMASLCGVLRNDVSDFPDHRGYLKADPELIEKWQSRLAAEAPGLKVGIAWGSGLVTSKRATALTGLMEWEAVLKLPDIHFVNLQYGDREAELLEAEQAYGVTIHRWPDLDLKQDIENALALTANMDLVINMGTSVGAMAGALGVPCWALLRLPEWSMFGTDHLPFFPQMRVYGRDHKQVWAEILDQVARDLRQFEA